jgi:hypothetical protein
MLPELKTVRQPSSYFDNAIQEALNLNKRKNELFDSAIKKIGTPQNKHNPNHGVVFVVRAFLLSGYKLSGQIVDSVWIGHLLIAVVGSRPLFELMVNTIYVFNHPQHKRDVRHRRRVWKWRDTILKMKWS